MGKTSVRWSEDKLIRKDHCFECGLDGELDFHHVVPEILGGTKTIPLCYICHGKIHNRNFVSHRLLQKIGIEKAKKEGRFAGRKHGTKENPVKFLGKSKSKKIIELLLLGENYQTICEHAECSPSTIVKVRKMYEVQHNINLLNKKTKKQKKEEADFEIPSWMLKI